MAESNQILPRSEHPAQMEADLHQSPASTTQLQSVNE